VNLQMGGQVFADVSIPLLWGTRAVVQDKRSTLSVIDLSGPFAKLEILADKPAPGIEFAPDVDGFRIRARGADLYRYSPTSRTLMGIAVNLPEVQITPHGTRVGSSYFAGNVVSGFGVGIAVTDHGIGVGAPLPPSLALLMVPDPEDVSRRA
jgi:hypothetical protein